MKENAVLFGFASSSLLLLPRQSVRSVDSGNYNDE
jgi:hypothetical protein